MTHDQYSLTVKLARAPLAQLPTPLVPAPHFAALLGNANLFIKRDDLTGVAFGGNKTRQLEFILAAAVTEGADTIITTAAVNSNLCRSLAAGCAKLRLRCVLLLRGSPPAQPQGNLLLDQIFGAEIEYIDTNDPYDPSVVRRIAEIQDNITADGHKAYVVHLPGQTGTLAAAAATLGGEEIVAQCESGGLNPDRIYIAVGSGLTLAGLVLVIKHRGLPWRPFGISVQQPAGFIKSLVVQRANEASVLLGLSTTVTAADFDVDDRFVGPGYGLPSGESIDALLAMARSEGILLDPIYSGKCAAAIVKHAAEGAFGSGRSIVFVHTGGGPGIFQHAVSIARHLESGGGTPTSPPL